MPPDLWLMGAIFVAVLGALIGSFLNVCIYRIPLDQSVVTPRSRCMSCGKLIPWYHNLPVISYFVLRGKCAYCKAPFSFRYAFVEMLTAFLFLTVWCMTPPGGAAPLFGLRPITSLAETPVWMLFLCGLIIATFVDFDHFIIPDSVSIGGMVAGVALSALVPSLHGEMIWWRGLLFSAIGLVVGFAPLQTIRLVGTWIYRRTGRLAKDEYAMGFGDIKFIGAIGAFLGASGAIFSIMAAALVGTIVALPFVIVGKKALLDRIPFGPYLALGAALWFIWGHLVVRYFFLFAYPSQTIFL
ncbi:MAG: prepilin peptidase [Kiritimatiellaeota bacterium]|nr:prepilin peptidase [Kiritimatiellota bacterium]